MTAIKRCCANCIEDDHLRRNVIPELSNETGKCSYCGSNDQALVEPIKLREYFEFIISPYTKDDGGKILVEWLKNDWALFQHERMDIAHAKDLLADILDDGEIVRHSFTASASISNALVNWDALRSELMHANRFFPQTDLNLDRLEQLLSHLLLNEDDIPKLWYRTRVQQTEIQYTATDMGAPPKHLASHGRANPAGIPYLYIASDMSTAISEVRPHTGDQVTVACIAVPAGLKIVDLRHPRRTVSPFILPDENELALLRCDIEFLEKLGQELTRPVLQKSAAYDYIPSQYLCEYSKNCGFDGVMYKSSVGEGVNVALFYPDKATIQNVSSHRVSRVSVDFSNL